MGGRSRDTARWAALLLGWVLALPAQTVWAKIGEIERVQGNVMVLAAGAAPRAARAGEPLEESQVLRTGGDGEAVVRFVDNALLVLRPGTEVELSRYRFRENDASSYSALRLLKGGLRFVTGMIGKLNREQVQLNTPIVTIGIRGTDFDTVYRDIREQDVDAGTYTCVSEGGTYMRDENGRVLKVDAGQTGFVTSADFVAKGLATATRWGLIRPPAGLFRAGTFDGQLQDLRQEGLRRLQGKISENLPSELRSGTLAADVTGMVGGLGGLFKKKEKKSAGCGS